MSMQTASRGYDIVDFAVIRGVVCPCGIARRAFADIEDYPATVHVTEISVDARLHYHKRLTETYYFLDCCPDARMQLNDEIIDVHPGLCILIRPGVRHRAIGKMKVLIVVLPKFDPEDEWFDEAAELKSDQVEEVEESLSQYVTKSLSR
jgi:mannose-6-phosphate isomerase-like protein (cupin superfamily)